MPATCNTQHLKGQPLLFMCLAIGFGTKPHQQSKLRLARPMREAEF